MASYDRIWGSFVPDGTGQPDTNLNEGDTGQWSVARIGLGTFRITFVDTMYIGFGAAFCSACMGSTSGMVYVQFAAYDFPVGQMCTMDMTVYLNDTVADLDSTGGKRISFQVNLKY